MNALHVTFRVGEADYAIPVTDVLHLDSYDGATRIPGVPCYVAGLVQVRGRVVPVVDLRARFGLPPADRTPDHRVVVVQIGARIAGLLADSARDVMQLDDTKFEKPPDMIERQSQRFVRAVVSVAKRLILLVDVPRVIGEELPQ